MRYALHVMPWLLGALLLSSCTPPDAQYCKGFGVEGTAEYGKCLNYYHQQEAWFGADYAACALEADRTYPQSLYDTGGFARVYSSPAYWGTPYYGSQIVNIPPDYARNAEVDRLRLRIVGPCMQDKGWNSPQSWQAGRASSKAVTKPRPVSKVPAKPLPGSLPWLN